MLVYPLVFLLGTAIGSFINVVALRYDPEGGGVFGRQLRGRSRCPHCGGTLGWRELIPIASFVAQKGRCRSCRGKISLRYPTVELLSGLALTAVFALFGFSPDALIFSLAALALILVSLIDIRHYLIPDILVLVIGILGLARLALGELPENVSFLGHYGFIGGLQENVWLNRLAALVAGGGLLAILALASRGRAMGWGDVKLAAAGGLLLGWPDIVFSLAVAFVAGSLASLAVIARGRKTLKDAIPFGPFIALGIILTAFLGYDMLNGYLKLFGLA